MQDITAMCYELHKTCKSEYEYRKKAFEMFKNMISDEIEKGTDLSPYLEVEFNLLKMRYEITLQLPATNLFNSESSN